MATTKNKMNLYQYLDQSGILETNDDALIKKARAAYWKKYQREYKREKRGTEKEYTVRLSKSEESIIEREAAKTDKSITQFIKESSLAYVHKAYVVPKSDEQARIEQLLSHCYDRLNRLNGEHEIAELGPAIKGILEMETMLREWITKPISLEDEIKDAIREKSHYVTTIKKLISEYDY
jgi:hypothetical protein